MNRVDQLADVDEDTQQKIQEVEKLARHRDIEMQHLKNLSEDIQTVIASVRMEIRKRMETMEKKHVPAEYPIDGDGDGVGDGDGDSQWARSGTNQWS